MRAARFLIGRWAVRHFEGPASSDRDGIAFGPERILLRRTGTYCMPTSMVGLAAARSTAPRRFFPTLK
jgi:hypothetical protein